MSEEGGQEPEKTIPYSRFQEVVEQKNALKQELAASRTELQALSEKSATVDTLAGQIESLKAAHKAEIAGMVERMELMGAGITDDEGQTVARALYQAIPEKERPKTIGDYLGQFRGEGDDVPAPPKALAAYLQPSANTAGPETPAPRQGLPRGPRPGTHTPAAPNVTAEAMAAAREKAQRTGDWTEYQALRKQIV